MEKNMSKSIAKLYYRVWMPLKSWARQTFSKKGDDDNNPFDTPFAIL